MFQLQLSTLLIWGQLVVIQWASDSASEPVNEPAREPSKTASQQANKTE